MSATIHYLRPPTAPRSFTGAEPAPLLPEKLCQDIEYGISHCLTELHVEQLEAHCIRARQLIDIAVARATYDAGYISLPELQALVDEAEREKRWHGSDVA